MATRLRFDGLEELKAGLRNLPAELTGDASSIVTNAAEGAKADMRYPRRTGDLADHLVVTHFDQGRFSVGAILKNTSPLAHIFESGTQARHTALGANRGSMPPGHVFIPAVVRRRRQMWEQLKALLVSKGLVVSGDAG